MAKDGTNRGGARVGAGRKPKALQEKLLEGNLGHRDITKIDIPDITPNFCEEPEGVDIPRPDEYLSALQRDGKPLGAAETYTKTYRWLARLGCDLLVSSELIEQYSVAFARWKQCEQAVTKFGLCGKHPTCPSSVIQSPFVAMSHSYQKQTSQLWFQIYSIVKENCSADVSGASNPADDMMERLLRSRKN